MDDEDEYLEAPAPVAEPELDEPEPEHGDDRRPDKAAARRRVQARQRRARARSEAADRRQGMDEASRRRRRGRRRPRMSGDDDGGGMRISWTVRRVGPGTWEGEVVVPAGYGEAVVSRVRDRSPGEAIEAAVMGAAELCAAADECGFVDFGTLIPGLLNTATGIVSSIANRGGKPGVPPVPPSAATLPGPMASLAHTAAMRPGGYGYPGGPPSPWGGPAMAPPGYGPPPGYGFKPF